MNKQELIDELKKEIEAIKNVSNFEEQVNQYDKGKRIGLEIGWMFAEKLDEPEITEYRAWLNEKVYGLSETISNVDGKGEYVGISKNAVLSLIDQLSKLELKETQLVEVPQFIADYLERCKNYGHNLYGVYQFTPDEVSQWIFDDKYKAERIDLIARAWLSGYTIEPPKTLQVIVKNYDSTVYKTELPEDEAMKLIEGWKG